MHYQKGKNRTQLFMASMEDWVAEDSWARIVDIFVDALPLKELGFTNSELNKEGNLPYHPGDLFKLIMYGYRKGIRSANQLAEACTINMEVVWLMQGLRPSPRTINYFRANNTEAIENAHRYFIKLLKKWRLLDGKLLALDSVKIRAQNSLKNNFNKKRLDRHIEYVEGRIEEYLNKWDEVEKANPRDKKKQQRAIAEKINELEDRLDNFEDIQKQIDQSSDGQVSLTDPDARAVIRRRNIVEVGYNIQATVDSKHKMVVDVFSGGVNDLYALSEAAQRAQEVTGVKKIDILADKGYHNGIELSRTERMGVRPFVAPRQQSSNSLPGFTKQDFIYDSKKDAYKCPAGKLLKTNGSIYKKRKTGKYRFKRYLTSACQTCPLQSKCTTRKQGRLIERPTHQVYVERNDARVKKYPEVYKMRQAIVEHVFGTWKRHWGMDYSLLKGKPKVLLEYRTAALIYNLMRTVSLRGKKWLETKLKKPCLPKLAAVISLGEHQSQIIFSKKCANLSYTIRLTAA